MRRFRAAGFLLALLLASQAANADDVTVVDGGSMIRDGHPVEIWGIIAPARTESCATQANGKWDCGEQAYAALAAAASAPSFACEEKEPGFVVCTVDGKDVARALVASGLVRARQGYRGDEARAREARVGLWR